MTYVNVYLEDLAFGGPEEGGWHYRVGEPIESIKVNNAEEAETEEIRLKKKYSNAGRRPVSSVLSEGEYGVRIEDHSAKPFPETRPCYE